MEKGWCWRAAERRSTGLSAPEDPAACLSPCPDVTERVEELLDLVTIVRRQLRVGFGGPYGLDWNVVARVADDSGIETSPEWWLLLAVAEAELILVLNPPKEGDGGGSG